MSIASRQQAGFGWHCSLMGLLALLLSLHPQSLSAATLSEAQSALIEGNYELCIKNCKAAIREQNRPDEDWFLLQIRAQLVLGQYTEAAKTLQEGLEQTRERSIRLYFLGRTVMNFQNRPAEAARYVERINELAGTRGWAYRDPENLIALGETALVLGEEPRFVLEFFFDPGRKADPPLREAILAAGQLALDKEDFKVAGNTFQAGLQKFEEDPDLLFGLAKALSSTDMEAAGELLERALEVNPRHIPSLLALANQYINAEAYPMAEDAIDKVLNINKDQPIAWAYKAAIAHFESDTDAETTAYERSLKHWKTNPEVSHTLGKKLSQKYRFKEGAAYQRTALEANPEYTPAQIQLAQDLLRLGDEAEGWEWAAKAHDKDGYNITAYNLVTLKTTLDKYTTLETENFIVRMPAEEAPIFGQQVVDLLEEARDVLTEKYDVELERRTIVELFGNQKDFGVRTFGMPHNPGFLGVCFGNVVTANSPSAQGGTPSNWRAVLWHEFCHVITLNLTNNKMPRWLSEGISVYEELERDPSWGQSLTPDYRERILSGNMTPVSQLSAAFMRATSNEDMQFAYYESTMVIQFLVQTYGRNAIIQTLRDVGKGVWINDALAAHTAPINQLDEDFETYAEAAANAMGEGLNWDIPDESIKAVSTEMALATNPSNYFLLLEHARQLIEAESYDKAIEPLNTILEQYPIQPGNDAVPRLLAQCYRGLEQTDQELELLRKIADNDHEAADVYIRLINLDWGSQNWEAIHQNIQRLLAVNPLIPQPYRFLADAAEALNNAGEAISAYQTLLALDPADPAEVHYNLARLLHQEQEDGAHRHVLQALEEAPRYRDAFRLLLAIKENTGDEATTESQNTDQPGFE